MIRALLASLVLLAACAGPAPAADSKAAAPANVQEAVFAGGCFWCAEHDMEAVPGVIEATSGYTGGTLAHPSYEDVGTETTGHYESVKVRFDANRISYRQLVDKFFRIIDPTDAGGQFCDRGPSYRTAVFVTPAQRADAEASKAAAAKALGQPIATQILPLGPFWPAEGYHQDYAKKNPLRYGYYRTRCGRDARVREVWSGK